MIDDDDLWAQLDSLLERYWPPALRDAPRETGDRAIERALWRALDARGWLSPWWPRRFGGREWSAERQLAFQRRCASAAVPWPRGQRLGPALWRFGTQAQLARHLEAARDGSVNWDYALGEALHATPTSGGFELSGVAAAAPEAEWLAALATSQPRAVLLLVELPPRDGADVVRFDRHFVPATRRLGGDGLEVARSIAVAPLPLAVSATLRRRLDGLRGMATGSEGRFGEDEALARRFDALDVEITALEGLEQRMARGADAVLEGALAIRSARLGRRLGELIVDLLGYHALPNPTGPGYHNEPLITRARPEWVRVALASQVDDGLPEWAWVDAVWTALEATRGVGEHR